MSDTPRTDAEACFPSSNDNSDTYSEEGAYVDADFARQLERELAYARKQRDALAKAFEKIVTLVKSMPDSSLQIEISKQSLAAVKGVKQ
jgi:hypothetical protein